MNAVSWLQINGWLWMIWATYWFVAARNTSRTQSSESRVSRWLHLGPTGLAFAMIFIPAFGLGVLGKRFLPECPVCSVGGDLLTFAALLFGVWARVHLGRNWSAIVTRKEGHRLIRTGPYRLARHPIYTGLIFGALGAALVLGEVRGLLAVGILVVAYWRKIRVEERLLTGIFGEEYVQFQREVKALVPWIL